MKPKLARADKAETTSAQLKEALGAAVHKGAAESVAAKNVRAKLEDLCRSLQQRNMELEQQTKKLLQEEEAKRVEMVEKFQASLANIQEKFDEDQKEREAMLQDNMRVRKELERLTQEQDKMPKLVTEDIQKRMELLERASTELRTKEEEVTALKLRNGVLVVKIAEMEEMAKQQRAQVEEYAKTLEGFKNAMAESDDLFKSYSEKLKEVR